MNLRSPNNYTPPISHTLQELANRWGVDIEDVPQIPSDHIESLQSSHGNKENGDFDELLDEIATVTLQTCPQFAENLATIKNRLSSKENQYTAKNRQLELYSVTKRYILEVAGINPELSADAHEQARQRIQEIIAKEYEINGDSANPLRALKIIQKDQDNNDFFRFPQEIMPKNTTDKWLMYTDAVKTHLKTENSLRRGTATPGDLKRADEHRKIAHDSITRDMMGLLNITDFDEMRRTVAKMRDSSFPNVVTGEEERVNRQLKIGVSVTRALYDHLFPEHAFLPDPDDDLYHR